MADCRDPDQNCTWALPARVCAKSCLSCWMAASRAASVASNERSWSCSLSRTCCSDLQPQQQQPPLLAVICGAPNCWLIAAMVCLCTWSSTHQAKSHNKRMAALLHPQVQAAFPYLRMGCKLKITTWLVFPVGKWVSSALLLFLTTIFFGTGLEPWGTPKAWTPTSSHQSQDHGMVS